MMEDDRYCIDVFDQIAAVQSETDNIAITLLENYTKRCLKNAIKEGGVEEEIVEVLKVVKQFVR